MKRVEKTHFSTPYHVFIAQTVEIKGDLSPKDLKFAPNLQPKKYPASIWPDQMGTERVKEGKLLGCWAAGAVIILTRCLLIF